MFKKFLILMVLTVLAITSSMAMDPVRIAGQASSTNVKNVTLDLTIRVYDASNNEIYHVGIPDIYFDQESAFSFVWDALFVNYNPLYLLKIENSLNGIILFESRLDKVINAQTQYRAYVDPDEINGAPTAGLVLVSNGVTSEWSTISPSMLTPLIDLQTAYDNSANSAPYISAGGVNFGNGKIIDVTGNKIKIVRERTAGGNIGSAFNASVSNPEDGYSAIAASIQDINYDDAAFIDAAGSEYSAIEGKLDEGTDKWFGLLGAAVNMDGGLPTPTILKAGVIGVTPLTTAAGALGVTFGGNDYAGYFVGDVNVTAAVTALTYNGFTLPAGDAPMAGDVLASTGTNKILQWVTPSGGGGGGGGGASWLLGGNLGTTPPDMFLGTLDAQDVVFKLNSTIAGTIGLDNNTSLGLNSMHNVVTSINNTGMGAEALYTLTSGTENTAVGYQSMYSNSTGNYNTAVGTKALYSNGAGMNNTAVGFGALYSNGTGYYNTALGYEALRENSTGSWNTASGYNAMHNNSSGAYNTVLGYNALYYNTDGIANVAIGYNAGSFKADGSTTMTSALNSVYIGNGAKGAMAANTNEIAIGYNAIGAGSNTVTLGSASSMELYCMAAVNTTTAEPPNLFVDANGKIMKSTTSGGGSSTPTIVTGSGSPIALGVTPGKIGDLYVDIASGAHYVYMAYGTAAGEWTQLN